MFGATGTLRNTRFQCENRLALAPTPYEAAGGIALERHFGGTPEAQNKLWGWFLHMAGSRYIVLEAHGAAGAAAGRPELQ